MTSTASPHDDDGPMEAATHDDGTPFRFELIHQSGTIRTYGDSLTELVAGLIPGYETVTDAQADELRLRYAVDAQVRLQAELTADVDELEACSALQRQVLLGDRHEPPELHEEWDAPIAVVLVDTYYQPDGPLPRPTGSIIWLSPRDEASLLASLADAGVVTIAEHTPPAP